MPRAADLGESYTVNGLRMLILVQWTRQEPCPAKIISQLNWFPRGGVMSCQEKTILSQREIYVLVTKLSWTITPCPDPNSSRQTHSEGRLIGISTCGNQGALFDISSTHDVSKYWWCRVYRIHRDLEHLINSTYTTRMSLNTPRVNTIWW